MAQIHTINIIPGIFLENRFALASFPLVDAMMNTSIIVWLFPKSWTAL
jgi:hypothetical protein